MTEPMLSDEAYRQRRKDQHDALAEASSEWLRAIEPMIRDVFAQIGQNVQAWMSHQGFWVSDNTGEKIALMHSELSEALEADRKDLMDTHLPNRKGVEVELADALIRIFDFATYHQLDLAGALVEKQLYNLTRPYKHGKSY